MANKGTVLIIGASRGLGLGLARGYLDQGWRVIATKRGDAPGLDALAATAADRLMIETLDVTDEAALASLHKRLAKERLDVLFMSAGMSGSKGAIAASVTNELFMTEMLTNALAPVRVVETFASLVAPKGVITVMSSVLGSVSGNTSGGYEVYRASKAALNTMLRSFAARHADRSLLVMHPGWVRTDMGGAGAPVGIEESVAGMIETVAGRAGKAGCVYLDYQGHTIGW